MKDINLENFDKLFQKAVITGDLVTKSQIHIGSGEPAELHIQEFISVEIDGQRIPYLPGSSLKGVFRSIISQTFSQNVENYLFGVESLSAKNACAAHIKIFDALPIDWKTQPIPLYKKPGVAIDRRTGAASPGMLFSIEVLPPEIKFEFRMILENINLEDGTDEISNAIKYLLKELQNGNISIGAKTTGGLGRVQLQNLYIDYITAEDIRHGRSYKQIILEI